ncbi:MAG: 1-deoxy-D-xylulose-5-phosphate reductoisomerase, partial [Pseudomonadota bacterium]
MKRVSIFGATGSIGVQTIDLIERNRAAYKIVALTGGANIELLAAQARALGAEIAVTAYPAQYGALKDALSGSGV